MDSDLVAFVRGYGEPTSIYDVASELQILGAHGASWPMATSEQWRRDLLSLVAKGELTMDSKGKLWVPVQSKPTQLELF